MKKVTKTFLLLCAMLTINSCAKNGLSTDLQSKSEQSQDGQSNNGNNNDQSGGSVTPIANPIDQIDLKSRVDDSGNTLSKLGGMNGALTFDFDKTRGEFIIMIPMPNGLVFTPSGGFKNYPDITFGPIFDATTGKVKVAVRIPVKYVLKGINTIPAARLPNGDSLPAMPAGQGELPSLGLSFPQNGNTQVFIYIGINALGLYVTLPDSAALPLPINITVPVKNKDKSKTYGFLTYVNAKSGHPPGLFVSTGVPNEVARVLEDYFGL
ncbi:MAG: hypothetical protein ACK4VO_09290 [Pseudobdellovibrio sp.]